MDTKDINLEDIWAVEQSILDVFDALCTKHNLTYLLAYGTLLGAVRHGGFIPWDDDIDVIMPREDYEKLFEIWHSFGPNGYILEDEHTVEDYENNFAKIRKDHTTFLQFEGERKSPRHKGFFLDVFPADKRPKRKSAQLLQKLYFAVSLLYNRGYTSGTKGLVGFVERTLLFLVPRSAYRTISVYFGKKGRKWNNKPYCGFVFSETIDAISLEYPPELFDGLIEISFNGKKYKSVADKENYLRITYGDYMQLPPEEERIWKHHPIIVDFEHNYEELSQSSERR